MASPYTDEKPMPAEATRNLFVWASGFGIGALLVLFGFLFLIGIGELGHSTISGPSPAGQSAATAPAAPGPAPNPAPQTGSPTNSQAAAPAPAQDTTGRAPTRETTGQAPKPEPNGKAPAKQSAPTPAPNKN